MKEKTTRAGKNEFKNRIICGDCGAFFGSKVWHSTSSYKKTIWRCNEKYKGTRCKTPHLEVEELKALFVKTINKILESKADIIESFSSDLYNVEQEKKEVEILEEKLNEVVEKINDYVKGNMKKANDQTAYQIQYGKMVSEYEGIKEKINKLNEIILEKESNKDEMDLFISNLKPHELVNEYDEELFRTTVEKIYVYSNGAVRFCFINGDKVDM